MENFYELTTIVLGIAVIAQYFALKKKGIVAQRMMFTLDKVAQKKWHIRETAEGYEVTDEDGDRVIRIVDKEKVS